MYLFQSCKKPRTNTSDGSRYSKIKSSLFVLTLCLLKEHCKIAKMPLLKYVFSHYEKTKMSGFSCLMAGGKKSLSFHTKSKEKYFRIKVCKNFFSLVPTNFKRIGMYIAVQKDISPKMCMAFCQFASFCRHEKVSKFCY